MLGSTRETHASSADVPGDGQGDSDLSEASLSDALYPSRGSGHPYYIVAPPYANDSAGVRILHVLCHLLNLSGHEAFIDVLPYFRDSSDLGPRMATPLLTQETIRRHAAEGLRPIVVSSETVKIPPLQGGVQVRYIMNFVGLLGGPTRFSNEEMLFAYSDVIATTLPTCAGVLYIPGSDWRFFKPGPEGSKRHGFCAYLGKYLDVHNQPLPESYKSKVTTIIRRGNGRQSAIELRRIFQESEALYIFENTALATEALLCGCPVIAVRNRWFDRMIAEREHGSAGLTWNDSEEGLSAAKADVNRFRADYLEAQRKSVAGLRDFIATTQDAAVRAEGSQPVSRRNKTVISHFDAATRASRLLLRSLIEQGIRFTLWRVLVGIYGKIQGMFRLATK